MDSTRFDMMRFDMMNATLPEKVKETAHESGNEKKKGHIPGNDEALWAFLIGDMIVFTLFFCMYVTYRSHALDLFRSGQALLDLRYGVVNTLLLLTSSLFVASAVKAFRIQSARACANLLGLAFLCGLAFAISKIFEYQGKINAGKTPFSDDFFTFYYVFTGIHLVHLLIGISVLAYGYLKVRLIGLHTVSDVEIESGASYWHMVDLLWIVIFPLLYLLP